MQLPDIPTPNSPTSENTTQNTITSESTNGLCVETDPAATVHSESTTNMAPPTTTSTLLHAHSDSLCVDTNATEKPTTVEEAAADVSGAAKTPIKVTLPTNNPETHPDLTSEKDTEQPVTEPYEASLNDETHDDPTTPTLLTQPTSLTETINSLPVETSNPPADVTGATIDNNLLDKYHATEGLLLLGTDMSSADDSQVANNFEDKTNNDTDSDSNKTIMHSSPPANTVHTSSSVKSPKKGVLNFRQIGIKRHLPVDSSDPSAIRSPPGSPDTHAGATKPKIRKNKITATQTKDLSKPKNANKRQSSGKGNSNKPTNNKKAANKSSTSTKTSTSTRWPNQPPVQQDQDGKYSIKRITITGTTYYCCSFCHMKFDSLHGLNAHHEKKHPPVQCDVCNRTFITPNLLIHHSYTYIEQSFNCEHCEKSFPFKSQLDNHSTVHTQTVKHKCEKCGKEFVRTGEYNIHMRGHANIQLKCPVKGCDYENTDK